MLAIKITFIIAVLILFSACGNGISVKKEYYKNGAVLSVINYKDSIKDGKTQDFYPNGKLEAEYFYVNDTIEGDYISYDSNQAVNSRGFFYKGKAVGPTSYYYKGKLILYNERDLHDIYYIKKYDSTGSILLKEEGECISPYFIKTPFNVHDKNYTISFLYAEPSGYDNELKIFVNKKPVAFKKMRHHLIDISFPIQIGDSALISVYSDLKSATDSLVCSDSLITTVKIIRD